MNIFYKSLINQVENKMAGYVALLNFRYQNLCVKADATSLMPVNVMMAGEPMNIEDVAKVAIPDDYHLAVFPNQEDLQQFVADGIFHSHPEFKLEVKTYKLEDKEHHYLLYKMPEVDKNRHDLLEEGVKSLHDECHVRIEEIYAENMASLTDMLNSNPEGLNTVKEELDRIHDDYVEKARSVRDEKLGEIEEAYRRYLEGDTEISNDEVTTENGISYNVTQGIRMDGNG